MAEEYYCKYCGDSHAALSFLMSGDCPKSPNRRHQLYVGSRRGREGGDGKGRYYGKNRHYRCKYCGHPHVTIAELTEMLCIKSPNGYHQPYEGEDKPNYVCKYCGSSSRSIERLTRGSCSASPNKHHQPEE
jgi:DNA-directed RNA polymerase subunit RPC12/RpoP